MSQITNYSAMTDAELNTAEANALTALRMVKAEHASRKPAALKLPVSEINPRVANSIRHEVSAQSSRHSAAEELIGLTRAHDLYTVKGLRALAACWGVGVTSKMNKAQLIDTIVDMLVGYQLDSDAIRRL